MNRKSSIQHALISSIISMLICCTMLVGSTFAWFSDSVSSGKNRISAGNLEVDLLVLKDGEYVSVANGSGDIFAESGNEIIWEPNVTKVVHLAVENSGSLALKYDLLLSVSDQGLGNALDYAIIPTEKFNKSITEWTEIIKNADPLDENGALYAQLSSGTKIVRSKSVIPDKDNSKPGYDYFTLIVHMGNNVENKFQAQSVVIDLSIHATQASDEADSFGSDFDIDAKNDYIFYSGGNFITTWNDAPEDSIIYLLTDAVNTNSMPLGRLQVDKSMTIVLADNSFLKEFEFIQPDKTLTLKNGTSDSISFLGTGTVILDSLTITSKENQKSAITLYDADINMIINGKTTVIGSKGGDGISVPAGSKLHLSGAGNLTAIGNGGFEYLENHPEYSNTSDSTFQGLAGSGIGNAAEHVGEIIIDGLKNLTALGYGHHAHGIGGQTDLVTIKNTTINHVRGGFAQSKMLIDTEYGKTEPEGSPAIGIQYTAGTVTLDSVKINRADGGSKAAAIGGAYHTPVNIIIKDSTLNNIIGGNASAGIGGSRIQENTLSQYTNISITNSTIQVTGGDYGAAIGSGYDTYCSSVTPPITTINISGNSKITAKGGRHAAAIGTGYHAVGLSGKIESTVLLDLIPGEARTDKPEYSVPQTVGFGVLDPSREGALISNYTFENLATIKSIQ